MAGSSHTSSVVMENEGLQNIKSGTLLVSDLGGLRKATPAETKWYAMIGPHTIEEKQCLNNLGKKEEDHYYGWLLHGFGVGTAKPEFDRRIRLIPPEKKGRYVARQDGDVDRAACIGPAKVLCAYLHSILKDNPFADPDSNVNADRIRNQRAFIAQPVFIEDDLDEDFVGFSSDSD